MPLNLAKGNMYPWVTHTWNPIRGQCPHKCSYCYVPSVAKRYGQEIKGLRLVDSELKINLYKYKDMKPPFIVFVGSTVDMFAVDVPSEWIDKVLEYCRRYPNNTYLFQSKNPRRFNEFYGDFPGNSIFGTTIESNYLSPSKAPKPYERASEMMSLGGKKMVSVEPILDFDVDVLFDWVKKIKPKFVSIGADSKGHKLQEPSKEKVDELIERISVFTEVRVKSNLKRLMSRLQST